MKNSWEQVMPILSDEIEMGNVFKFDCMGNASYLSEELLDEIDEIEKDCEGMEVVAVLNSVHRISEGLTLRFRDFLLMGEGAEPTVSDVYEDTVEFFSFTKNLTDPESSEFGYVGVREEGFGFIIRAY